MSMSLQEHDYIGLSDAPKMESSEKITHKDLNLKATELRLGLPGSESPGKEINGLGVAVEDKNVHPHGALKCLVSGAKRGFSDTIDAASGKWVFSASTGGSELDLPKNNNSLVAANAVKDVVKPSAKPLVEKKSAISNGQGPTPAAKAQVVGWPPIRSFRKNTMAVSPPKNDKDVDIKSGSGCLYVKVSMDGAPYLRKVDLTTYSSYTDLSSGLEKMFSCFTIGQCGSQGVSMRDGLSESRLMDLLHGSEYVLTYEDKDGDWMLVGDVPWEMFISSCKRMRIMKSSDAIGLAPRAMEKCRSRN